MESIKILAFETSCDETSVAVVENGKNVLSNVISTQIDIHREYGGVVPEIASRHHIENIMPVLEIKARRIGGATYQVPIQVRPERRQTLGLRWLVTYSRNRGEKTMKERLAKEILDAVNNTGASVKKREDTHKMAEANKAFAHYGF